MSAVTAAEAVTDVPTPEADPRVGFLEDGTPYDTHTGEILAPDSPLLAGIEIEADKPVDEREAVEQLLERRGYLTSKVEALKARKAILVANMDAQIADVNRRLRWWEIRFSGPVVAFARKMLTGRSRTAQFDQGSVSFRKTSGTTAILQMDAAVEFVRRYRPDLVRVEVSVNVTAIKEAVKTAREQALEMGDSPEDTDKAFDRLPFIAKSGEGESITINT